MKLVTVFVTYFDYWAIKFLEDAVCGLIFCDLAIKLFLFLSVLEMPLFLDSVCWTSRETAEDGRRFIYTLKIEK